MRHPDSCMQTIRSPRCGTPQDSSQAVVYAHMQTYKTSNHSQLSFGMDPIIECDSIRLKCGSDKCWLILFASVLASDVQSLDTF